MSIGMFNFGKDKNKLGILVDSKKSVDKTKIDNTLDTTELVDLGCVVDKILGK